MSRLVLKIQERALHEFDVRLRFARVKVLAFEFEPRPLGRYLLVSDAPRAGSIAETVQNSWGPKRGHHQTGHLVIELMLKMKIYKLRFP
jgi:hypothetical protein